MPTRQAEKSPAPRGGPLVVLVAALRNRGFVACVVLLAAFTIGFEVLAARKNIQFRKEALPLKKPLSDLEQAKLAPMNWRPPRLRCSPTSLKNWAPRTTFSGS